MAALQEPVKAATAAACTGVSSAAAGEFASGTWRLALFSIGLLAFILLGIVMFAAADWHGKELQEVGYDQARDGEADRRKLPQYEREVRGTLADALGHPLDPATHQAQASALLVRQRKHISAGRQAPIELVVLDESNDPDTPEVVAQAGRLDQSIVGDPASLNNWLESLGDKTYAGRIRIGIGGRMGRLVGISDTPITRHDQTEIQRASTHMQTLLQNQEIARMIWPKADTAT